MIIFATKAYLELLFATSRLVMLLSLQIGSRTSSRYTKGAVEPNLGGGCDNREALPPFSTFRLHSGDGLKVVDPSKPVASGQTCNEAAMRCQCVT